MQLDLLFGVASKDRQHTHDPRGRADPLLPPYPSTSANLNGKAQRVHRLLDLVGGRRRGRSSVPSNTVRYMLFNTPPHARFSCSATGAKGPPTGANFSFNGPGGHRDLLSIRPCASEPLYDKISPRRAASGTGPPER